MTSYKDLSPELEKAVQTLLKPPHVHYLKELHAAAKVDPTYIFNNEAAVGSSVQQILVNEGVQLKPGVIELQWRRLLGIAFHRIEEK